MTRKIILSYDDSISQTGDNMGEITSYYSTIQYTYTGNALGDIIENLPEAHYLRISSEYVAIYHPRRINDETHLEFIFDATHHTLQATTMVIMCSIDGKDIPDNVHENLYNIFEKWYYYEYESSDMLLLQCDRYKKKIIQCINLLIHLFV